MKLSVGKRVLMFFHWLLSLLICAALVIYLVYPAFTLETFNKLTGAISSLHLQIIGGALLAIYIILAIAQICLIFSRGRKADRDFITVDSSETGRVRIAISAIEQMVRQSVHAIDGISEMKIRIDSKNDAIVIGIVASIVSGSHVPTLTMNMQNAIRKFVEMNCGVAVSSVMININSVTNPSETSRRRVFARGKKLEGAAPAPVSMPETIPAPNAVTAPVATPAPVSEAPEEKPAPTFEPEPSYAPQTAPTYEPDYSYAPQAGTESSADADDDNEGGGYVIDPDYKPTLTLDPFGEKAREEASAPADACDEAPADDEQDLL